MITLQALAQLARDHHADLAHSVAPMTLRERMFDTDREPIIMSVVNLSQDSAYRESVANGTASAVRKARVQAAQGAHLIDLGAESSRAVAARVSPAEQIGALVPVIEQLAHDGITTSVDGYDHDVVRAALHAGAGAINLTGSHLDDQMFTLAAEHNAGLILCHVLGSHPRALDGTDVESDPIPAMLDQFGRRIDRARELGVSSIAIDPGLGFGFKLDDMRSRAHHQAGALLNSFRLRRLGVPICQALPHAIDIFEDQFRSGEGFFAVLAHLGQTGIYRTHEVPLIRPVLESLHAFSPDES